MSLVRVIPLGGVGEIGKNCTIVEQGDDIVVIDCGLSFPTEEMLGVDIVIPDFTYLIENKHRIRGIFITHAHEDHVGGLPYLLPHVDCPLFVTEFTHALVRGKLDEKIPQTKVTYKIFKPGDTLEAGSLSVESVRVTHSIPETCCMAVRTVHGIVFFTADFKFDFTPVDSKLTDITRIGELGNEGVLLLLSDSTNVERQGWGPSERQVTAGLQNVFATAKGRILLTTFASNIHRMQQVFDVAAESGRKVAAVGRRMEQNLDICERMGYVKIPKGIRVGLADMKMYQDNQLAILTTGSQGEPMSALVQMSKGTYGRLQIRQGDTLIYSARPIPGNEGAIWRTINRLFRQGCNVIYDSPTPIHVSGHAYQEELKMMLNLTKPFYVAPVHGEPRHQHVYNEMAMEMGYPEHRVFTLSDGDALCITETSAEIKPDAIPYGRVLVDNSGIPGVSDEVLRDRFNIANDGMIVVTIVMDMEKGEIIADPILQSKGLHGPADMLDYTFDLLCDALQALSREELKDVGRVRADAAEVVKRAIQKKAQQRPLVLPVVIEV
ncbi:MAG: ribonuclease J [Chlorobia bacterium]|nr:ribonuclease J [Fimbriimonadaceae bacterium]